MQYKVSRVVSSGCGIAPAHLVTFYFGSLGSNRKELDEKYLNEEGFGYFSNIGKKRMRSSV